MNVPSRVKIVEALREERDRIRQERDCAIRHWRSEGKKEMVEVQRSDANDQLAVCTLVQKSKYEEAMETAGHLDTIVREAFSDELWAILLTKSGHDPEAWSRYEEMCGCN